VSLLFPLRAVSGTRAAPGLALAGCSQNPARQHFSDLRNGHDGWLPLIG